jgi:hypothetical protein
MAPAKTKKPKEPKNKGEILAVGVDGDVLSDLEDEVDPQLDKGTPALAEVHLPSGTATESHVIAVAGDATMVGSVVTPEKQVQASGFSTPQRHENMGLAVNTPPAYGDHTFYVINQETAVYFKHDTKSSAMEFFEKIKVMDPVMARKCVVQDFPSETDLQAHIDLLLMGISSKKEAASCATAQVPLPHQPEVVLEVSQPSPTLFYIINQETLAQYKFETKELAISFFEATRSMDSGLAAKLLVQDFPSEAAVITYINAMTVLRGDKLRLPNAVPLAGQPLPVAPNAAINPMAASKRNVSEDATVGRPESNLGNMSVVTTPAKRPKLGFSTDKNVVAMDATMKRYQDALRNSNSKLEVWHLVCDGANFDVWGLSLKENDDYYWSWKPSVLEKAIVSEQANRLFEKEDTTMDEMLSYVRAANIRETPGGPSIPSSFTLKNGKKMDRMMLFGLINSPCSEGDVKAHAVKFCNQCKNVKIQMAYRCAMENTMKADSIKKDCTEGGPLWEKLGSAANNIVYKRIANLAEILCDHTIEEIITLTYGYSGNESPSMWDRRVFKLAFGETKEST